MRRAGLAGVAGAWLSSGDVAAGKPAPDAYLAACARSRADRGRTAAVEDSESGLLAAHNAGLAVVAVPNCRYQPAPAALEIADVMRASIAELTPTAVASLAKS